MQPRRQVAALPVRQTNGVVEVLLVTSRETGRWIIPKGWTSKRLKDFEAAAREAMQEAGVDGRITTQAIGTYSYIKREIGHDAPVEVTVYLLAVTNQWTRWREKNERQRGWFSAAEAAGKVSEPELSRLIHAIARTPVGGALAGQGWVDAKATPEAPGKGNGQGGQDGDGQEDAVQAGPISKSAE
jgi:8-oxo-dGTP pyrophosphatase MutT (NUDIX family)